MQKITNSNSDLRMCMSHTTEGDGGREVDTSVTDIICELPNIRKSFATKQHG